MPPQLGGGLSICMPVILVSVIFQEWMVDISRIYVQLHYNQEINLNFEVYPNKAKDTARCLKWSFFSPFCLKCILRIWGIEIKNEKDIRSSTCGFWFDFWMPVFAIFSGLRVKSVQSVTLFTYVDSYIFKHVAHITGLFKKKKKFVQIKDVLAALWKKKFYINCFIIHISNVTFLEWLYCL